MTDMDIANAAAKQMGEEEGGKDENEEEGQSIVWVSQSMALQGADTVNCILQRGFECSDITATRKICTAIRRSLNSPQKQATSTHYFSK
jgi:hypothetical protein